jgi:hypothetical protein
MCKCLSMSPCDLEKAVPAVQKALAPSPVFEAPSPIHGFTDSRVPRFPGKRRRS